MPLYTYRCENCGVQFDQQQKFTDSTLVKCPECGKKTLRKVFQPVGIVFKGSGFYATDHRSPSGQSRYNHEEKSSESKPTENKSSESSSSSSGDTPAASTTPAPKAEKD